ncbi:Uncharacterised protein [Vibrio cholerae]|nr:Uncharacterised protein [Vibrio cholerae]
MATALSARRGRQSPHIPRQPDARRQSLPSRLSIVDAPQR